MSQRITVAAENEPAIADKPSTISGRSRELREGRYTVKISRDAREVESALRLRHQVFNVELAAVESPEPVALEFDSFDSICAHLIVSDRVSGSTIGTYRLNTIESAKTASGFYSYGEFSIEDLPGAVIENGIEIGRACIAREHRNSKVLFLLWKDLAKYLQTVGKRYFFGCCSIFTRDPLVGERAYRQLAADGHFHPEFRVEPRKNALYLGDIQAVEEERTELPNLFNMYLRLGAKVCGPPIIDSEFGTIDFFVVFDVENMNEKYRSMFFS